MDKLFLLGIKHSGKTTLMEALSSALGIMGTDSDALLVKRFSPLSVRDWYRTHGKDAFMEEEASAVRAFLSEHGDESFVMSLGGGASDNAPLLSILKGSGKLIYVERREDAMLPVILKDGIPPFLDEKDPRGSFHELYVRRDRIYREIADITVPFGIYRNRDEEKEMLLEAIREAI